MKTGFKFGYIFVLIVSVLFVTTFSSFGMEPTVLRYATQMPKTHHLTVADYKYAKTVAERTNGRIKIEVYPAGQLYKGVSLVKAVMSGAVEMGIVYGGALTGPVPLIDVFDIPFLFSDYQMIQRLWDGRVGTLVRNAANKRGFVILSFGAYGDSFCLINNKRPLKKPEDFSGLKIRCNTPMAAESVKVLGASPLMMSSSEVYAALQRGTIDGASTGLGSVVKRKWFEVAKYATITSSSYSVWPVMINGKVWAKLPRDIQEVMQKAALESQAYIIGNVIKKDEEHTKNMREKMEVTFLSEADRGEWQKALQGVSESFVKRTGQDGDAIISMLKQ